MNEEQQKCPDCGRPLYSERPSCMYCGYERPLDGASRLKMKKRLVARALGVEESDGIHVSGGPAAVKEKSCPGCGTPAAENARFCKVCGARLTEAVQSPVHEIIPRQDTTEKVGTSFRVFKTFSPDFSSDFRDYLTSGNILFLFSLALAVVSMYCPFGIVPRDGPQRTALPALVIAYPAVLKVLFLFVAVFIVMDVSRLLEVVEPRKVLTAVEVLELAVCVIFTREVFGYLSNILIFGFTFAAAHLYVGNMVRKISLSDFWAACILLTVLVILIITPHIRTVIMSDTPKGMFKNTGFTIHIIASTALMAGTVLRCKKNVIIE